MVNTMNSNPIVNIKPLTGHENFYGLTDVCHICAGGEAPWLKTHDDVYEHFKVNKSAGFDGREVVVKEAENCRDLVAKLWNTDADRISFAASSTDAMAMLGRRNSPGATSRLAHTRAGSTGCDG